MVWKLSLSPKATRIFAAPGNAGTAQIARNLDLNPSDLESLHKAVTENHIDLIVVGPENPLASGIVDYFRRFEIPIFGPTRAAAQLESSKAFSKEIFQKYHIPCAKSKTFTNLAEAEDYIRQQGAPLVVKADGLAAGKGVIVAETENQALEAVASMMKSRVFGNAGDKVIIEEKLTGKEMSYFAVTDGRSILPTVPACDYKRIHDNDEGPNTGGMGSYSPPYFFNPSLEENILHTIIEPTVKAMGKENHPYQGVLFAGLMVNNGDPKLLEYNVRFGDPECQVIMPRLKTDLLDIILGTIDGNLKSVKAEWNSDVCVSVVLASGGYPGHYKTGLPITGLETLDKELLVFHAGTRVGNQPGEVLTNGGRVLTIVARGKTTQEAREIIYANLPRIHFEGMQYRKDIGRI